MLQIMLAQLAASSNDTELKVRALNSIAYGVIDANLVSELCERADMDRCTQYLETREEVELFAPYLTTQQLLPLFKPMEDNQLLVDAIVDGILVPFAPTTHKEMEMLLSYSVNEVTQDFVIYCFGKLL